METEIWKAHPEYAGIEVSSFGRVRSVKGHYYKILTRSDGYLQVSTKINGKPIHKLAHRLVAETFIPNSNNLPQVNHKDCNKTNNNANNLEWCNNSYNQKYRDKFGISNTESKGHPLFAVNLGTLEVSYFRAQREASRALEVNQASISAVIKGKYKQAGGYYFKEDDGNGIEIDKDKLNDIVDGMRFRGGVFAVNLYTLEVSRFNSQNEASRALGVFQQNINRIIKGKRKTAHGYWFTNDDGHAVDVVKNKLHDIGKTGLKLTA